MITFKDYITEKINKKEFEDVLNNKNLLGGCEFEFYFDGNISQTSDEEAMRLLKEADKEVENANHSINSYNDAVQELYDDIKKYGNEKEDIEEAIEKLESKLSDLEETKDSLTDKLDELADDLDNEDDVTFDAINDIKGEINSVDNNIEKVNDEISDAKSEINDINNNIEELENKQDNGDLMDEFEPVPSTYSLSSYYELINYLNDYDVYVNGLDSESTFSEQCWGWFEEGEVPYIETLLGIEVDEAIHSNSEITKDDIEDADFPESLRGWDVKEDSSLDDGDEGGVEIVTPIMVVNDMIDSIERVFKWIDKNGHTNDSCGFHVHMSIKTDNDIDPLKLILFAEEELVYKYFEDRRGNHYARGIKEGHIDPLKTVSVEDIIDLVDTGEIVKDFNTNKYFGIHLTQLEKNHIEFRYMGGSEYHTKFKEVRELIVNYGHWLSIACDPTYKRKEYIKKLNRLVNTFNRIYVDYTVTRLKYYIDMIGSQKKYKETVDWEGKVKKVVLKIKQKLKPYETKLKMIPKVNSYGIKGEDIKKTAEDDIKKFIDPLLYDELGIMI